MSDEPGSKVFDMPHARVTLTPIGPGIEIEVWPKAGQSAYAVVDPTVAVLIARHLVELAATQLTALRLAGDEDEDEEPIAAIAAIAAIDVPRTDGSAALADTSGGEGADDDEDEATVDNVVDLFSRRRPGR